MFHLLIGDLTLRWIITTLFGVSIATYVYVLVVQHDRWTSTVNHLLHLTMSVAMILMAWRIGMDLPTVGPMVFFLLAAVWFVRVAGRVSSATRDRLTNCYYAVMMAAMAWMYAVMNGSLSGYTGHSPDHARSASPVMDMSGMQLSAQEMFQTLPAPGWITAVNWIATLGFAVVAVYWPCRYIAERRTNPVPHAAARAGGTAVSGVHRRWHSPHVRRDALGRWCFWRGVDPVIGYCRRELLGEFGFHAEAGGSVAHDGELLPGPGRAGLDLRRAAPGVLQLVPG